MKVFLLRTFAASQEAANPQSVLSWTQARFAGNCVPRVVEQTAQDK